MVFDMKNKTKKISNAVSMETKNNECTKYGLFIGRFQPFHLGHLKDVKKALKTVDFLIIIIGSSQHKREERNPLSAAERKKIIMHALNAEKIPKTKYSIFTVNDFGNHYLWINNLLKTCKNVMDICNSRVKKVKSTKNNTLIFCGTEASGHFTAKLLSKKGYNIVKLKLLRGISGTKIRKLIREEKRWQHLVPDSVVRKISRYLDGK